MKTLISSIIITLSIALLSGCASIVSKSDWPVTITSNPSGATVIITNSQGHKVYQGITPTTVVLSSKKGYFVGERYRLVFSKDGHIGKEYALQTNINGWYFGNIILGGLIGMVIVDPLTGAMYKLEKQVSVDLAAKMGLTGDTHQLYITTIDQIPEDLRGSLIALP